MNKNNSAIIEHDRGTRVGSRLSDIPEPNDPVPYQEKLFTNWIEFEAQKLHNDIRKCH